MTGSDLYGSIGRELIPFGKDTDAREFQKDHKGKAIVRFSEVIAAMLKAIEYR